MKIVTMPDIRKMREMHSEGKSNREIAAAIGCGVTTARKYARNGQAASPAPPAEDRDTGSAASAGLAKTGDAVGVANEDRAAAVATSAESSDAGPGRVQASIAASSDARSSQAVAVSGNGHGRLASKLELLIDEEWHALDLRDRLELLLNRA